MKTLIPLILFILSTFAQSVAVDALYPATVKRVIDADTVVATVHLPWGIDLRDRTFRALDYDGWESSKRRRSVKVTDAEVVKGKIATGALKTLLERGLWLSPPRDSDRDVDPYDRDAARFHAKVNGKLIPVADWMRANGHTRTEVEARKPP